MLGRDKDRLVRIVQLRTMPPDVRLAHPDIILKDGWGSADQVEPFRSGIVLVDPLGNQVMRWPKNPDIKKLNQDLARLLRASRIG